MDGTLVDTEPYWMECEFALAEKYGGTWSHEDGLAVVGGDLIDSATYMREHMGIDRTPRQIVEELLDGVVRLVEQEVPWRPGARELLAALRAQRRAVRAGDHVVAPVRRAGAPTRCPRGPSTPWSAATKLSSISTTHDGDRLVSWECLRYRIAPCQPRRGRPRFAR